MMDINTFQQKADIYGGDLSRWPKELLPAAAATLKNDAHAQSILDEALHLDAQFAALSTMPISSDLRTRILAIPDQFVLPKPVQWFLKPTRLAASIAICSFLGLFIGVNDARNFTFDANDGSAWILAPEQSIAY